MLSEPCRHSHPVQQMVTWLLGKEAKRIHWSLILDIKQSLSLVLHFYTSIFTHTHKKWEIYWSVHVHLVPTPNLGTFSQVSPELSELLFSLWKPTTHRMTSIPLCHKRLQKEPAPMTRGATVARPLFDWLALWCLPEGHASLCLKMTAPCRGKSGSFRGNQVLVGEHRVCVCVCRSTETPSLCSTPEVSPDFIHICATMWRSSALLLAALTRPKHGQQTERELPLYWLWPVTAARQSWTWWKALVVLFVDTTLKRQPLLPPRAYTGKWPPLLECKRKIKHPTCFITWHLPKKKV